MIVPVPRAARTSEENVLPLINIVFLLLIFFMITGALSATLPFDVEPPTVTRAEADEPPGEGVAIAADGRIAFAGEHIDIDELVERAAHWREETGPDAALPVQADATAASEHLLVVVDRLREAGVRQIRLIAVGDPEER